MKRKKLVNKDDSRSKKSRLKIDETNSKEGLSDIIDLDGSIKKEDEIKIESSSEEEFQNIDEVSKNIKSGDNPVIAIKVESSSESDDQIEVSNGKRKTTIPEVNHISVGEIKIEDSASESDEETNSVKIKGKSGVSKWKKEDDVPTTSKEIKKEKKLPAKNEKTNESDSDEGDSDYPSDDEEFLSDEPSGDEEFLSDGDENNSDNQNLNVDNKDVVVQLLNEYHKRPQLWFQEIAAELNDLKENQLFRGITNALSKKFNMKFNMECVKTLLNTLRSQYETEIERQLKENQETTAESSNLWFYDKMFFVKDDIEKSVKLKLEKSLKPLDDNNLANLIDIYKNYDVLWDTNNLSFPNKQERRKTMQSMCLEIKNKMNISYNTFKLEYQLLNIHKRLREDKQSRFKWQEKKLKYKSTFSLIKKCNFLQNHQEPYKCEECFKVFAALNSFREHKAEHAGTPPFKCNICGEIFKHRPKFVDHYYTHNGVNYNCSICGKKYITPKQLKRHMIITHAIGLRTANCDICGKGFGSQKDVKRHIRNVHLEQPTKCNICKKIFKNNAYFRYHKKTHNDENTACGLCKKNFRHSRSLAQHMKVFHSFICMICGEACSDMKSLNHHMASHEGKEFNCDICGEGFDDLLKVNEHKFDHKEFQCKICDKVFETQKSLNSHSAKHRGKKYKCKICGTNFAHRKNLREHMDVHKEQRQKHKCSFCENYYVTPTTLKRHLKMCKQRLLVL